MNPAFNGGFVPNSATNPQNRVNDTPVQGNGNRSRFPMSSYVLQTERFAEISPVRVLEMVAGDSFNFSIPHNMKTYTLASPLLQYLRKHMASFFVPKSAVHPVNWEREQMAPKIGDDIPQFNPDTRLGNSCILNVSDIFSTFGTVTGYVGILHILFCLHNIFCNGSLINSIGLKIGASRRTPVYYDIVSINNTDFNDIYISNWSDVEQFIFRYLISGATIKKTGNVLVKEFDWLSENPSDGGVKAPVVREFFDWIQNYYPSDPSYTIEFTPRANSGADNESSLYAVVSGAVTTFNSNSQEVPLTPPNMCFNISRLVAYHLLVAQFFTNDNVDDINTGKKWMQMMKSLSLRLGFSSETDKWPTFSYNGDDIDYDVFSATVMHNVFVSISSTQYGVYALPYLINMFCFEKSLLYEDYFLSARLQPLAVEQTLDDPYPASVEQGALATVRSILVTRFLNAVNSIPNRIRDYLGAIRGVKPAMIDPQPKYISRSTFSVFKDEVTNTADDQGQIELNLNSSSTYSGSVQTNDDGYLFFVTWYDIPRVYANASDRFFFHYDRFDDFQDYLQNIGDQPIYANEFCPGTTETSSEAFVPIGYLGKDAEYKQLINIANGAFADGLLPSWGNVFTLPPDDEKFTSLTPANIRQYNSYWDVFYKSLTGYTLSSYFHFIESYNVQIDSSRPMQYVNNILMP